MNNNQTNNQDQNDQDQKNNLCRSLSNKQIRSFEERFTEVLGIFFTLPYNIGIIILTLAMWSGTFSFAYYSAGNFNLSATIAGYLFLGSLSGIIYGQISATKPYSCGQIEVTIIGKLGLISLVLSIFMLMSVKIFYFYQIGLYLVSPISMFSFFLLLKNIWIGSKVKTERDYE